ncbi:MAG: Tab2 family RNA-binding protein [Synechocystis sp.]|nr:Tab2 family RNA-binding protein [Synechocystis sp.]
MSPLPPPQPLPESLWGDRWRFLTIAAQDLQTALTTLPQRYQFLPETLWPVNLGLAADLPIPGMVIYAGRQARFLGQWLSEQDPCSLTYIADDPRLSGGLVLKTGEMHRWIVATFADPEMATAAAVFHQRQRTAKGLHFLWVQPDDSGVTSTGVWLLQA